MKCFVDTSAFLAVMNRDDEAHAAADKAWRRMLAEDAVLVTNSYVLTETFSLCQRRLGVRAVRGFCSHLVPLLQIDWIGKERHEAAAFAVLAANRRDLGLVDCASFETMRAYGITSAFAFDRHFAAMGFDVLP